MAKQEWEHKAVDVKAKGKPLGVALAAEGIEGWELVQAWTDSQKKDWLLFKRPKEGSSR